MTVTDAIIVLDAQLEGAPYDVAESWRIARGWLRRRERPSSANIPIPEPITNKHFVAVTGILEEAKAGISEPPVNAAKKGPV